MTSKYPSISLPAKNLDSLYQCVLDMRQVVNLLVLNAQSSTGTTTADSAQIFATSTQLAQLAERVAILEA